MLIIPGYKTDAILCENKRYCIVRATEIANNRKVVIKALIDSAKTLTEIRRIRHEYAIGQKIDSPYSVKPLALYNDTQYLAIIQEDDEAIDLEKALPAEGFKLAEFLKIAVQIVQGLGDIHQASIIHKDVKPANLIMNLETGQVKYIDYGSASQLKEENQPIQALNKLEGTLAYISPEQTGRMNRAMDYRTDFYSLGVTFYQLLSGKLPFDKKEAMALIHCHLATHALPLNQVKPEIPATLAAIVSKLLMKNAEDRYQSTQGLLQDLQRCQQEFLQTGTISVFELGQQDLSEKFQISQKLYGREKETTVLLTAFERVSQGAPEVLVVAGYSGIGKSILINEIQKPITLKDGRFLTGKFDQLSKATAYSAISQALQGLVKQLLAETESNLQQWRKNLLAALGNNGQVIIALLPELEHIIGKQSPVAVLGPVEAKNRFNKVFQNFIGVFTKQEHPLVLFLDDLQWADLASLELIKLLMISPETQYFFLIGAYRDNEVDNSHPAIITLEDIRKAEIPLQLITLASLDATTVQCWIADSLNSSFANVKSLAEMVYQKTQGNPFFVKMFLRALYDENLLYFSKAQHWQWDNEKIRQRQATANVVEFMISRINQLSESTRKILAIASCLGHRFKIDLLAVVTQQDRESLCSELDVISDVGMIYQTEDTIQFAHDRVQEAAYFLLADKQKKATHLFIGRTLLHYYSVAQQTEEIFEIVDQLNGGSTLITDDAERLNLVQLNLTAGQKAKNAAAYVSALNYIQSGIGQLDEESMWQENYELAFILHTEKAELEYLNGSFQASEHTIQHLIGLAHSVIEQAELYNLLMVQKTLLTEDKLSIQLGKTALALLNIELPELDLKAVFNREVERINTTLANRAVSSLIEMPEMTDLQQRAAFKLLTTLMVPTIIKDYDLYCVVVAKAVNLALEYGHMAETSTSYVFYAGVLCGQVDSLPRGYEFGRLAIQLAEKYNNPTQQCKILHVFATLTNHWFQPLRTSKTLSNQAYQIGFNVGEVQYTGYSRYSVAIDLFYSGEMLFDMAVELSKLWEYCAKTKNQTAIDHLQGIIDTVQTLTGQKSLELRSDYVLDLEKRANTYALCHDLIYKSQLLYLYGQFENGLHYSLEAEKILSNASAHYVIAEHNFYYSLNLAAVYDTALQERQADCWQQLRINQQTMAAWAEYCPANFQHKYWLVAAEMARIQAKHWKSSELYDKAIKAAKENGVTQDEALANELAGKFWLANGREAIARTYLNQAYLVYQGWGAKAKVELFKKEYGHLLKTPIASSLAANGYLPFATTSNTNSLLLDMDNVIRASHVIASDINLDKLLFSMMKIIIETAGAEKGVLLLHDNGTLSVEAEYTSNGQINVLQATQMHAWQGAHSVVEYVKNSAQTVTLNRAVEDKQFGFDTYIAQQQIKSLLCMPIMKQDELKGILYIENNLTYFAFPQNRVTVLTILSSQMAISLENARLVQTELEAVNKVADEQRQRAQEAESYKHNLEEFIDTVCHEIRNPLNGAYGCLEAIKDIHIHLNMLLEKHNQAVSWEIGQSISQQRDNLQEVQTTLITCLEQQTVIVNDVLDLSKLENNKIMLQTAAFSPKQVIERAIQMFQLQLSQKRLKIYYNMPQDFYIEGDSNRFTQVITNLLSNAIKFTSQGNIKVDLSYQATSNGMLQVSVQVKDTGIGISKQEINQLFQPFNQANLKIASEYGGTGLGLVISQKLVAMMGGKLNVTSEKGRGSRFQFTILAPTASQPKLDTKRRCSPTSPSAVTRPKHILIVEDNTINQKILANYLRRAEHHYQIAKHGLEALTTYKKAVEEPFDIVFMDIEMPVMDGLEATRQIRLYEKQENLPAVTIIGLSGNARKEQIQIAMQAGMDDYITKPFHKDDLLKHINRSQSPSELGSYSLFTTRPSIQDETRYLHKFQQIAQPLLEQHYPFTMACQHNQVEISLLPQLPERPTFVCGLLLEKLNDMLQSVFEPLKFTQQTLTTTSMQLEMATREQAILVQEVLAKADFAQIVQTESFDCKSEKILSA
jgi:predicted ATPase/signal transduction histidine kinase/DNA-binding NarL/FixJ family response regulator/tRNA A-37 threonylcarbamoyl transferase component Bud32